MHKYTYAHMHSIIAYGLYIYCFIFLFIYLLLPGQTLLDVELLCIRVDVELYLVSDNHLVTKNLVIEQTNTLFFAWCFLDILLELWYSWLSTLCSQAWQWQIPSNFILIDSLLWRSSLNGEKHGHVWLSAGCTHRPLPRLSIGDIHFALQAMFDYPDACVSLYM